jgi:LacI family transcriptional regulator, fructose operon transcriptional repressor
MPSKKKTTIYDIANEAQTSASTVAAVLNGTWKKRRIGEETAKAIRKIANQTGYTINMQARGLRRSRSGLIGMIVPMLDNRFFSSLAQAFESHAREQGLSPVVVSTLRDPEKEQATVRALISHNVEALFLAGATDPDSLAKICKRAGVTHVNIDLPGSKALSVISDNYNGAKTLTNALLARSSGIGANADIYFIGGIGSDYNTQQRMQGFRDALLERGHKVESSTMRPTGYAAELAESTVRDLYLQLGRLPDVLFVNSTLAFEGVVRFLRTLPIDDVRKCSIGCFDWDPYIELLHFPVLMVRQNATEMVAEGYRRLKQSNAEAKKIILIPTELIVSDERPPLKV